MERKTNTDATVWFMRIGTLVVSMGLSVSSWFLNQAWTRINETENRISKLELASAATSGNRFTSNDWAAAKMIMDTERMAMDRRIIRLEEALPGIKDSLIEIKQLIKEKHATLP